MFREIKRKENALGEKDAKEILRRGTNGVLALTGDNGYNYAVPLSYVYVEGEDLKSENADTLDGCKIYFHCSSQGGHKIDALKNNDKVSFCVVDKDEIIAEEFNTLYKSAVVFGKANLVTDLEEKQKALEMIVQKYSLSFMEKGKKYISSAWDKVAVIVLEVEHMSAKQGN